MSDTSSVPPEPGQAPTSETARQRRRRLLLVLIVAGTVFALAAVALLVRVLTPVSDATSSSTTAATSTPAEPAPAEPSPAASAAPTETAEAAPVAVPRPTSCEELYSAELLATDYGGNIALNPAWTQEPGAEIRSGSNDPELMAVIDANEHLTCIWASPVGASGMGLATDAVWVSAAVSATVEDRLNALGMECYPESGGLRCVSMSTDPGSDEFGGESHFLRDGMWLATSYSNFAPVGYTADMVATLWPEG